MWAERMNPISFQTAWKLHFRSNAMFDSESGRQGFAFLTWIVQNQITRKIIDQGESAAELGKNRLFGSDHFE
jgi:hypothetical protein